MSLSVGKPAIKSAPNVNSGLTAFRFLHKSIACSLECLLFILLSMRLLPDCRERWRCGIIRLLVLKTCRRLSSISLTSKDESLKRGNLGTSSKILITKSPSLSLPDRSDPQLVISTPVNTISLNPFSTRLLIFSKIVSVATDFEKPLPCGIMQKVQEWSHPF